HVTTLHSAPLRRYSYICLTVFFFVLSRPPPASTLFPYTTLFRSCGAIRQSRIRRCHHIGDEPLVAGAILARDHRRLGNPGMAQQDRKSTRLNSSHVKISYVVFCLKKKKKNKKAHTTLTPTTQQHT